MGVRCAARAAAAAASARPVRGVRAVERAPAPRSVRRRAFMGAGPPGGGPDEAGPPPSLNGATAMEVYVAEKLAWEYMLPTSKAAKEILRYESDLQDIPMHGVSNWSNQDWMESAEQMRVRFLTSYTLFGKFRRGAKLVWGRGASGNIRVLVNTRERYFDVVELRDSWDEEVLGEYCWDQLMSWVADVGVTFEDLIVACAEVDILREALVAVAGQSIMDIVDQAHEADREKEAERARESLFSEMEGGYMEHDIPRPGLLADGDPEGEFFDLFPELAETVPEAYFKPEEYNWTKYVQLYATPLYELHQDLPSYCERLEQKQCPMPRSYRYAFGWAERFVKVDEDAHNHPYGLPSPPPPEEKYDPLYLADPFFHDVLQGNYGKMHLEMEEWVDKYVVPMPDKPEITPEGKMLKSSAHNRGADRVGMGNGEFVASKETIWPRARKAIPEGWIGRKINYVTVSPDPMYPITDYDLDPEEDIETRPPTMEELTPEGPKAEPSIPKLPEDVPFEREQFRCLRFTDADWFVRKDGRHEWALDLSEIYIVDRTDRKNYLEPMHYPGTWSRVGIEGVEPGFFRETPMVTRRGEMEESMYFNREYVGESLPVHYWEDVDELFMIRAVEPRADDDESAEYVEGEITPDGIFDRGLNFGEIYKLDGTTRTVTRAVVENLGDESIKTPVLSIDEFRNLEVIDITEVPNLQKTVETVAFANMEDTMAHVRARLQAELDAMNLAGTRRLTAAEASMKQAEEDDRLEEIVEDIEEELIDDYESTPIGEGGEADEEPPQQEED